MGKHFFPFEERCYSLKVSLLPCSFAEFISPGSDCGEPTVPRAAWAGVAHGRGGCVGQGGLASCLCWVGLTWVCCWSMFLGAGMRQTHLNYSQIKLTDILEEDFCKFTNYSYVKKILIACNFPSTPSHLPTYLCSLTA